VTAGADAAYEEHDRWREAIWRHVRNPDRPGSASYWSPTLETASRDELREAVSRVGDE